MTTKTESLVERARLTEDDHDALRVYTAGSRETLSSMFFSPSKHKVADAQLSKALWAVVDWLTENCIDKDTDERYGIVGFLGLQLRGQLEAAGLEKPE